MLNEISKLFVTSVIVFASQVPVSANAVSDTIGALYTMSNDAEGNSVLMFNRLLDGKLTPAGEYSTGGLGTSGGLGNQGGLIIDPSKRWLFVVNAGSNDVSIFSVEENSLTLVDVKDSGGDNPVSLAYSHNLLYVLNAGGSVNSVDTISGFYVDDNGILTPIPGSVQLLSAASTSPAQISFNTDGDVLVVTEKATDLIDTFVVDADGVAGTVRSFHSAGLTPFGFAIGKRDQVIVSEASGGSADASSVSSYRLSEDGNLTLVSGAVGTTETAACWAVVTNDGRYAYVTNAGSGTISGYKVGFDGSLTLLDENGVTGDAGKNTGPLDMVISPDGRNLYTLNGRSDTVGAFSIKAKGGLATLNSHNDVPAFANGLAIR